MAATGYKLIESGTTGFQKIPTRNSSNLNGVNLLYTFAKVDEPSTPYGNLFKSFNLPITPSEIEIFTQKYKDTAFQYLQKDRIIVVEIPKGQYGELIDGKTFALTIPVTLNSIATSTTLYSTYFGYKDSDGSTFINNLNSLLSDPNQQSSEFGIPPSSDSNFNSNVSFLFSNDIQRPQLPGNEQTVLLSSYTVNDNNISNYRGNPITLTSITFSSGDRISVEIFPNVLNASIAGIVAYIGNQKLYPSNQNSYSNYVTIPEGFTNENIIIYDETTSQFSKPILKLISVIIKQSIDNSNLSWSRYISPSNKFPTTSNDLRGKRYASFNKIGTIPVYDIPVGILFQDKGIAVITDSTIVDNFLYISGKSSGYNGIGAGNAYTGDTNFAKIYFTNTTISNAQFDSITTEFIQNIWCIANAGEFVGSTNSTYADAYGEEEAEKPVFITSIGLYNANYELIGIGKFSEPVKKLPNTILPFNIKLVI
jgi:hypothetical protein